MGDRDRLRCEYRLLRYVPDAVRNEYVNIGVILCEQEDGGKLDVRFTRDWRRVRCLDPEVDTELLEGMGSELRNRLAGHGDRKLMRILAESLSLSVQMTEPNAYLAESLPVGLEELMRMYVEAPPRQNVTRLGGPAEIQSEMRGEFERAGVWDLLRKQIRVAEYTRPGDPLRICMGYRHNGLIKLFHAVSLEAGVDMAKVLAFSAADLRAGVKRIEKAGLELTAIIEPAARLEISDEEPERAEMYRFGVETMEEHQIRVLTTAEMAGVAATARRELRVE